MVLPSEPRRGWRVLKSPLNKAALLCIVQSGGIGITFICIIYINDGNRFTVKKYFIKIEKMEERGIERGKRYNAMKEKVGGTSMPSKQTVTHARTHAQYSRTGQDVTCQAASPDGMVVEP